MKQIIIILILIICSIKLNAQTTTEAFEVSGNTVLNGNLIQLGEGNTLIESTVGSIIIKTNGAIVEIDNNGSINITSSNNLAISAAGTLNLTADEIIMNSNKSIEMTAGNNIQMAANENMGIQASLNMQITTGKDQSISARNYVSTIQNNSSYAIGGNYSLVSQVVNMDAYPIRLNGGTLGAVRIGDVTDTNCTSKGDKDPDCETQIISSSKSVLIGN